MHDELRERCNTSGCTINDWLVAAIDYLLTGSSDFDFGDEEEPEEPELDSAKKDVPKIRVVSVE